MDRSGLGAGVVFVTTLALGACGAGNPHAQGAHAGGASGGEAARHAGQREHPAFTGAVAAFHDVLRPLWHSEPGAARDGQTCAQAEALKQRADAISAAPVPPEASGRDEAWRAASATLTRETEALRGECQAAARDGVPQRLEAVHTAFHQLIASLRGAAHP